MAMVLWYHNSWYHNDVIDDVTVMVPWYLDDVIDYVTATGGVIFIAKLAGGLYYSCAGFD